MTINIKILKLVSAICAALLVIIVIEWLIANFSESRLMRSIESSTTSNLSIDPVPEVDLGAKTEESYVDLVARPLFLKGRKPVEENVAEKEKEQNGSETFDWRLDGIYTGKNGLAALLSRSKDRGLSPAVPGSQPTPVAGSKGKPDNYRKVSENEDVDGWRLTQIKTDRVVFELGGESKELVLRKPKPKELPPEQANNQQQQNSQRDSHRPQARTKDIGQIQDDAIRRRSNRGQSIDSESEPAGDESENNENEE
jgi:hypothetical protein